MALKLYNTRTHQEEVFTPLHPPLVTMYNCGPTVYNYQHIGNMRPYVMADVLRRTLELSGYEVKQIMNITDVGHLVSDADEGEDKMLVGAQREGKSVEEIVKLYSDTFYDDLAMLNILPAAKYPRATAYIDEQKALIETLNKKNFLYTTSDGIYFDTTKFPRYADFAKLDIAGMQAGARVEMGEKKQPTDFAVWKFSPNDGQKREQEWDSPLEIKRKGFPGWHIECSAIIMRELGEQIDIHTGGVDHISVHHTNEIAQSESATGKTPFANFWLHNAHVLVDGQKMSKSLGNTYTLADLKKRGVAPLAYRYWLLTANYRTQVNFTWEALEGAQKAHDRLRSKIALLKKTESTKTHRAPWWKSIIENDLDTSKMLAELWGAFEDKSLASEEFHEMLQDMDKILGLDLLGYTPENITVTPELQKLLDARESARSAKDFHKSDDLRDEIQKLGYEVKDTPQGQVLTHLQ